jgi:Bifunctional DNA primase/polymerase, N-terminal/Protein of unknown function (DUF3987)
VNEILATALAFCDAGYAVVPARADGSKAPAGSWERYQAELPPREQVAAWLGNGTYDGFGLVCGAVSGGLEMLELEGRAIAVGVHAAYRDALAAHGLSELWQRISGGYAETTPSGGLHILYRVDGAPRPNTKLARTAAAEVLIETRGEGGFTIVAPSGGHTHPTGKPWQIARGGPATIATISEEERDALYAVASTLDRSPVRQAQLPRAAASSQDGDRPGDDYGAKVGWQDILAPHGWRPVRNLGDGAIGWCRPGKDGPFISATTRETGGLYVFSTSTPFDSETPYSKFAAYAVLSHGGDYGAAAGQLRREGYGAHREHDDDGIADLIATPVVTASERSERSEQSPPSFASFASFAIPVARPGMFAGILGDITHAAAPSTEADPVGIYGSLQAGAGAVIGPGPYVRVGNVRHPLLIWPLLMGRTGSGRKGEATTTAEVFLYRAAPSSCDLIRVGGLSSGEGLIERIADGVTDDKRLLVTEPEFTSVMARAKREGSTLAQVQRQAWDGRALHVLNRKALSASSSHIVIIGHVSPREFRLRMADADLAGGTYNRYLPLFVERSRLLAVPEPVAENVVASFAAKLSEAISRAGEVGPIQLGREATELWIEELYPEFSEADDDDYAYSEFARRAAPYCLRIAGLHAALDGRQLISKADLAASGEMVRYSIASARYVLGSQHRDPRMERLIRAISEAGADGVTRAQVSALFSRKLSSAVLDTLLGELIEGGGVEVIQISTGGRAASVYRRSGKP